MNSITNFSDRHCIVLQINPDLPTGNVEIESRSWSRIPALIYIPSDTEGHYFSCPFNYFQENASLSDNYIMDDSNRRVALEHIDNLEEVIITKIDGIESEISISPYHKRRLLDYFKFDVHHYPQDFPGFDCYAFASLLSDVKFSPISPEFNYDVREPVVGDIVILAETDDLPHSIKHWALCLGNDYYLSKFGKSDGPISSLLSIVNLEGMKYLYEAPLCFVATPQEGARKWDDDNG